MNERVPKQKVSTERKQLVIKLYEEGKTYSEIVSELKVNLSTAKTVIRNYKLNDCEFIEKRRGGNRIKKLTNDVLNTVEKCIQENPGITLREIKDILLLQNINISLSSINNAMRELKITLRVDTYDTECVNSAEVINERKTYAMNFSATAPKDRQKLIFIDECGFSMHLKRISKKLDQITSSEAEDKTPTVRGRDATLLIAMNGEGIIHKKVTSTSACNNKIFISFLQELLEKMSNSNFDNAWLIMDDAKIHKTEEVTKMINKYSNGLHLEYLPPFSPMLNPVEKAFVKIKLSARNILSNTKQIDLVPRIEESVDTVTAKDAVNYIADMMIKIETASTGEALTWP